MFLAYVEAVIVAVRVGDGFGGAKMKSENSLGSRDPIILKESSVEALIRSALNPGVSGRVHHCNATHLTYEHTRTKHCDYTPRYLKERQDGI